MEYALVVESPSDSGPSIVDDVGGYRSSEGQEGDDVGSDQHASAESQRDSFRGALGHVWARVWGSNQLTLDLYIQRAVHSPLCSISCTRHSDDDITRPYYSDGTKDNTS